MTLNADVTRYTLVNGEGVRHAVFFYGCPHKCKGCHNPQTHDINNGSPFTLEDMKILAKEIAEQDVLRGITITGGDPLFKPKVMMEYIREYLKYCSKPIWLYTGYTFEEITSKPSTRRAICSLCEVVIEGRFEIDKSPTELKFRGSGNQRLYFGHQFYNEKGSDRVYVYGHRNPDVDCLVSGYMLESKNDNFQYVIRRGDIIDDYSRKAFEYITGNKEWIKNLPCLENLHDFESTYKISVDTPPEFEGTLISYDHHKHSLPSRGSYRDVRNLRCGATAYLIFKDLGYRDVEELEDYADMALKTIYVDTSFLQNKRKYSDKDVMSFLQARVDSALPECEANLAVYDSIADVFTNGLKIYDQYGGMSATYAHLSNSALLTESKIDDIIELSKQKKNHISIVYSEGKTYVFYQGNSIVLSYFASRGTQIVPAIYEFGWRGLVDENSNN